ncbi:MAG: hypothetical protein GY953_52690 [bacterium]|nr:hypothetical protein [bacterium]
MGLLRRHRPEAMAGCVAALRRLAHDLIDGGESLPSLRYGVLALTAMGYPSLSGVDRDLLWRAFQVPVFEQCRCRDGLLYAEECHAHDGLHLRVPAHVAGVTINHESCVCGDPSPRIVAAPVYQEATVRELAVGA